MAGDLAITFSNAKGPSGAKGATGADGAKGPAGAAGPTGASGTDGTRGPTGASGTDGTWGPTGASGSDGSRGATGADGATGATGTDGSLGPTGASGSDGAAGVTGAVGATGAAGATGDPGPAGATGPAGPKGDPGTGGAAADTCAPGSTPLSGGTKNTNVPNVAGTPSYSSLVSQLAPTVITTNGVKTVNCAGTLSDFSVTASGDPVMPDGIQSYVITVRVNGSASALACTVLEGSTTCSSPETISLAVGDVVNVEVMPVCVFEATGGCYHPAPLNFDWSSTRSSSIAPIGP